MFRKIFLIAATVAVSPLAFASNSSPPIYFSIGDVKPGTTLNFNLYTVIPNMGEAYSLTCDIQNPNYSKQYPIVLGISVTTSKGPYAPITITLDGKPLNSNQAALTLPDNSYVIWPVYGGPQYYGDTLTFANYDNSDTATITNCVATPVS